MNNMNIDENTMQNIKNMIDNGNISEAISNISPEMIQNFSKMLSNQQNNQTQNNNSQVEQAQHSGGNNQNFNPEKNNFNNNNSNNNNMNFDLNNIDMNTIMKMSSILGKVNNPKDDPRANLLNSLKPYLRDSKKGQLDNYMSLLNVAKIADIMKDNNKENKNNV